MILYHKQAKPLKDMSVDEIICYSKYHNSVPVHVKIVWKNHTIYTQIIKSYAKYINFKKIDDHKYVYHSNDKLYNIEYKDDVWYNHNLTYHGQIVTLFNDLKKATYFLEIREAYIKIKMLPLINDICRYIGFTLINYNELNNIKVF